MCFISLLGFEQPFSDLSRSFVWFIRLDSAGTSKDLSGGYCMKWFSSENNLYDLSLVYD